ncbi:MAG TPA: hypothetical protein VEL79_12835 [Vicinamibacterales bacterium]|nr:hypothetical protein [Vicinamibacterales bacterium]
MAVAPSEVAAQGLVIRHIKTAATHADDVFVSAGHDEGARDQDREPTCLFHRFAILISRALVPRAARRHEHVLGRGPLAAAARALVRVVSVVRGCISVRLRELCVSVLFVYVPVCAIATGSSFFFASC